MEEVHYNCCQRTFKALCGGRLSEETADRIGAMFGGGIIGRGEACGVVTGGAMAIGLIYGEENDESVAVLEKYLAEVERRNGGVTCRDILAPDMEDHSGCDARIEDAVALLKELTAGAQ